MNIKTRILTLAAAGSIALAGVAGAAGYASAQEPGADAGHDAAREAHRTARQLPGPGRDEPRPDARPAEAGVQVARRRRRWTTLCRRQITQEQADKAKARIESGKAPGLRKLLGGRHGAPDAAAPEAAAGRHRESAATALNMTPEDLKAQLKTGKSIADVAGGTSTR